MRVVSLLPLTKRAKQIVKQHGERWEVVGNIIARRASSVPAISGTGREKGWISVAERLPAKHAEVIVFPYPSDYCMTAEMQGESASGNPIWKYGEYTNGWGHEWVELTRPVTHWMPYPDDPSEEKGRKDAQSCGACHGSGWVTRDADIGTDQECFVCDGTGADPAHPGEEGEGE